MCLCMHVNVCKCMHVCLCICNICFAKVAVAVVGVASVKVLYQLGSHLYLRETS
jgi:hypothetical protein